MAGASQAADAAEHVLHGVADNRKHEGFCKRLLLEFTNRFKTDAGKKRNTGLPAYNGRITMTLEQRWRRACNGGVWSTTRSFGSVPGRNREMVGFITVVDGCLQHNDDGVAGGGLGRHVDGHHGEDGKWLGLGFRVRV